MLLAVSAAPALAVESPYLPLAQAGGGALVLAEEPAQNEDIKTIMARYKWGHYFDKIPAMPTEQRRKLMDYYKKAREVGVKDRLIAGGLASLVMGYADIEGMRAWVAEYKATQRVPKKTNLPMPYVSFTNATEKFPEAQAMFASELEATKKMEAQVKAILEAIGADAERRSAESQRRSAEYREQIEALDRILKLTK